MLLFLHDKAVTVANHSARCSWKVSVGNLAETFNWLYEYTSLCHAQVLASLHEGLWQALGVLGVATKADGHALQVCGCGCVMGGGCTVGRGSLRMLCLGKPQQPPP